LIAAGAVIRSTLVVGVVAHWHLPTLAAILLISLAAAAGLYAMWEASRSSARIALLTTALAVLSFWYYSASSVLPRDFLPYFPHITTMLVLAFASQNLRIPAANGKIWRRNQ